jgi:hypothetical protein
MVISLLVLEYLLDPISPDPLCKEDTPGDTSRFRGCCFWWLYACLSRYGWSWVVMAFRTTPQ